VKADRTQEFLRARFKLLEEAQDLLAQGRQIVSPGMQVELILFEPIPVA
jgi:hypothetical protein